MSAFGKQNSNDGSAAATPAMEAFPVHRRFIRHKVRLKIRLQSTAEFQAWTLNLSEDGMCLTLPEQLPKGREVTAWIHPKRSKGHPPIQVRCRVVWHEATPKGFLHGVQFRSFSADGKERLLRFLAEQ
jgi:hypothetical protein